MFASQPQRFSPQLPFISTPQLSQSQAPLRKRSPGSKKSKPTISQSQAALRKKSSGSKQSKQNIVPLKSSKSSPSPRKSTLPLQLSSSLRKSTLFFQSSKSPRKSTSPKKSSLSPQFKPSSNEKLQELVERMDVEESSVESIEVEVTFGGWRVLTLMPILS
jgi:hypothetical protein